MHTNNGTAQQRIWNAECEAAIAEFLAPLSEDEQVELSQMLHRTIQHELKKMH